MADPDRTMKKGDTWPPLRATLTADGSALDITTADTVTVIAKSDTHLLTGTCTILDAAAGRVEYQWVAGDTDNVGTYAVEFEVLWAVGQEETLPNTGTRVLVIEEDLRP